MEGFKEGFIEGVQVDSETSYSVLRGKAPVQVIVSL